MMLVTAAESREIDRLTIERYGTPGPELMERAAAGATKALLERFPEVRGRRVTVCAGKGNNGGDGFLMARLLRRRGVKADVLLLGAPSDVRGDAALALAAAQRARVPVHAVESSAALRAAAARFGSAALLVDAVFGTGLNAPVSGLHAECLEAINASGVPIFAVDIPSGLHADFGTPLGVAIRAAATATFGFAKVGQAIYPGLAYVGDLTVVDIGLAAAAVAAVQPAARLLDPDAAGRLVPVRPPEAHKGTTGHVLVIAGSRGHSGAALMASHAACRAGAGLTTLAGPASLNTIFSLGAPEVMTAPLADREGLVEFDETAVRRLLDGKTAVIVGPGIGVHDGAAALVRFLLAEVALPMVVDADALTCVARDPGVLRTARAHAVLTPHPGEMARLLGSDTGSVQADRIGTARRFAAEHGCVLVLKGARTIIAAPEASADGTIWVNPTGNPGMASGGMGDALSGIVGALLAQRLAPAVAARLGAYLHGEVADHLAATVGPIGFLASDIIDGIPAGLARVRAAAPAEAPPGAHVRTRRRGRA